MEVCDAGTWGACTSPLPSFPELLATIRDFSDAHPDMELPGFGDHLPGLVEATLGADGKPVRSEVPYAYMTTPANFDQWYRDVPGVNVAIPFAFTLTPETPTSQVFRYENRSFFPIDGQGFGNEGRSHNYHFTLELETQFRYVGGEVFAFSGDDDLWVFMNGRLVIDVGGIHSELRREVLLDEVADSIGMKVGDIVPLKLFFAERRTVGSNFIVETTIRDWDACGP